MLTYVMNASTAESAVEFLCTKVEKVSNGVRPQMQDIIPHEGRSFFQNDYLSA